MSKSQHLNSILESIGDAAIAVSGGVDSMTLAAAAHRHGLKPSIVHGVSPAVPQAATTRVQAHAALYGWDLQVVDAGEFGDANYKSNPVNRCYFCKSNLYATIGNLARGTILSGANLDDLSDYRPGLEAAAELKVRHPFIEADMCKADVRLLARELGLGEVAELPSSPCLASRVETGIAIEAQTLRTIDATESWLRKHLPKATIRCRYRQSGWVIELDQQSLDRFGNDGLGLALKSAIPALTRGGFQLGVYRRGSAFLHEQSG